MKFKSLSCSVLTLLCVLMASPAVSAIKDTPTPLDTQNSGQSVPSLSETIVSGEILRGLLLGAEKYAFSGYMDSSQNLFSAYEHPALQPFIQTLESTKQNAFIGAFLDELSTIRLSSSSGMTPTKNEFETIGRNYKDQPSLGVQYLKIPDNSQCLSLRLKDYKPKIWRDPLDDIVSTKFQDIPVILSYKAHQHLDAFEKQNQPPSNTLYAQQAALTLQELVKQSLVFYRKSFYSEGTTEHDKKLFYEIGVSLNEATSVFYCKHIDVLRSQDALLTQKLYIHLQSVADLFDSLRKPSSPVLTFSGILKKQNEIATLLNGFVQSSSLSLGGTGVLFSTLSSVP